MTTDLLPCPFCGVPQSDFRDGSFEHRDGCWINVATWGRRYGDEIETAWNRRAERGWVHVNDSRPESFRRVLVSLEGRWFDAWWDDYRGQWCRNLANGSQHYLETEPTYWMEIRQQPAERSSSTIPPASGDGSVP